ncbi:hypothetical protein C5S39_14570 [Candidatus Methanophagaceae archaeon]|nr:hypothetical protein C5S39_14570 [Methanophagales archaeon]
MAVLKKIREFGKKNRIEFTHHKYLYTICAVAEKKIYIITAYYP